MIPIILLAITSKKNLLKFMFPIILLGIMVKKFVKINVSDNFIGCYYKKNVVKFIFPIILLGITVC